MRSPSATRRAGRLANPPALRLPFARGPCCCASTPKTDSPVLWAGRVCALCGTGLAPAGSLDRRGAHATVTARTDFTRVTALAWRVFGAASGSWRRCRPARKRLNGPPALRIWASVAVWELFLARWASARGACARPRLQLALQRSNSGSRRFAGKKRETRLGHADIR